jgi:hypothetical protein
MPSDQNPYWQILFDELHRNQVWKRYSVGGKIYMPFRCFMWYDSVGKSEYQIFLFLFFRMSLSLLHFWNRGVDVMKSAHISLRGLLYNIIEKQDLLRKYILSHISDYILTLFRDYAVGVSDSFVKWLQFSFIFDALINKVSFIFPLPWSVKMYQAL